MSKRSLLLFISTAFLCCIVVSCSGDVERLESENKELKEELQTQEDQIISLTLGTKFVDRYVDSLEQLEASIRERMNGDEEDTILIQKIKDLTQLVHMNNSIVAEIESLLVGKNKVVKLLMDHVVKLDNKVQHQEKQIAQLFSELDDMGIELENAKQLYATLQDKFKGEKEKAVEQSHKIEDLEQSLVALDKELQRKDAQMNEAFYFFGSKNELVSMDLIERSSILSWQINEEADFNYLTKVDIRHFAKLKIPSEELELLSEHPRQSYRQVAENGGSALYIDDYERFWSLSKVLIVRTGK
ncbi:MAG: hypothetical protein HQ500_12845 [Flavobacteriales bacterium]|nr:hypothetical protein [Flavobacteriales bacterium]